VLNLEEGKVELAKGEKERKAVLDKDISFKKSLQKKNPSMEDKVKEQDFLLSKNVSSKKSGENTPFKKMKNLSFLQEEKIKGKDTFFVNKNWMPQAAITKQTSNFSIKTAELIDRIIHQIKLIRSKEQNRAEFVIKSEEFGRIRVHLVMKKNNLALQVQVSEARTGQLLQNNFHYLKQNLQREGIILKDFSMGFNQDFPHSGEGKSKPKPSSFSRGSKANFTVEEEKEVSFPQFISYFFSVNYLV